MSIKLAFLHTLASSVGQFNDLCKELLPGDVEVFHIADEMLLKVVLAQGGLSPFIFRRVAEHVVAAENAGASLVLLTCLSICPCAEVARAMVSMPVLRIDEPMIDRALSLGERIGVATTASIMLKPIAEMIYERGRSLDLHVKVDSVLCEGAYKALFSGDLETHDRIIRDYSKALMARNDVILLAQASMARVAATIPPEDQVVPVLTSPRLAIERVREVIEQLTA